jgi:hypothetical protein
MKKIALFLALAGLASAGVLKVATFPVRHPVKTVKAVTYPLAHPVKTLKAISPVQPRW